jgi:hypothetical protein
VRIYPEAHWNTSSCKAWNKIKLSHASLPYCWNAGVRTAAIWTSRRRQMFQTDIQFITIDVHQPSPKEDTFFMLPSFQTLLLLPSLGLSCIFLRLPKEKPPMG